jgi:hypothetical protein
MPKTPKPETGQCHYCRALFVIEMRHGKLERIDAETGEVHDCPLDPVHKRKRAIVAALLRAGEKGKL